MSKGTRWRRTRRIVCTHILQHHLPEHGITDALGGNSVGVLALTEGEMEQTRLPARRVDLEGGVGLPLDGHLDAQAATVLGDLREGEGRELRTVEAETTTSYTPYRRGGGSRRVIAPPCTCPESTS